MADLFRGYINSIEKRPLYSVKDQSNWLDVPPTEGDYVGILRTDIVQLDFDSEEDSKVAMQVIDKYKLRCDILKTSRGIHVYVKDDDWIKSQSVAIFNAIGLTVDVGLGKKDRVVPLRITKDVESKRIVNGEEERVVTKQTIQREWLQTYSELDFLPPYFRPVGKRDCNLKNSNMRNQTLFTYILTLQIMNFTKEEIRSTIKTINDFVLDTPLSDKEIDMITRDSAFSEELFFGERGAFLHDKFGNYMLSNCNILKINGSCYIYTDKHLYSNDVDEFEKAMLSKIPSLKESQRKEVYKYICLKCKREGEFSSPKYIGFKDEILDIETMETFPYTPAFIINNRIEYEYNSNAYCEKMDYTLNKVCRNDQQIRSLLEEMIGYTLYRKNSMQVCFILTGSGSNGKSTILNCIKKLVGKPNYTSLDLSELEDSFKPAELNGKLMNCGDDLSAKYLENSSIFKKVVTGESFMVQKKYQQPFELESYATQIFSANELPSVKDKSDGFSRRILIVPFEAKFSKSDSDYDPFIEEKLLSEESITYLLKIAIDGLKRVLVNQGFTKSKRGDAEKEEYILSNNNVKEWIDDNFPIENNSITDVYMSYTVWCARNGCQPVKKLNLSKEIKREFGLVPYPRYIDGKTVRIYSKEKEE